MLDELRRLLLETNLSAAECVRRLDITYGDTVDAIVRECRRYVGRGRWVNQKTGLLCPPDVCTSTCAAEQTGLSPKTIRRRFKDGTISAGRLVSAPDVLTFSKSAVRKLQREGRRYGGRPQISVEDVREILRRAYSGEVHESISKDYGISRRQVSRIVSGERWPHIPKTWRKRRTA